MLGKNESKHSLCSNMKYLNLQRYLAAGILISENDLPCYIILLFCFHKDKVVLHRKKMPVLYTSDISLLSELVKHKTAGNKSRFVLNPMQRILWLTLSYSPLYLDTTEDFVLESEWYYMHTFLLFFFYSKHSLYVLLNCFV